MRLGSLGEGPGGVGEHQPVPTTHPYPSPWCLPAASEVAPSCPPLQAPRSHPIQTPASRGTLHVRRSRSSWKQLSSRHPSWCVQSWGELGMGTGPRGPPRPEGLGSSGLGTASDFCLPVSSAPRHLSCPLPRCHSGLCRALSQAPRGGD